MMYVHEVMNMEVFVNTIRVSGMALEKALAGKLREILAGVKWLRGWKIENGPNAKDRGFDLLATLQLPHGGKAALCVACKQELRPSVFLKTADKIVSPFGRLKVIVPVLALPFVSPRIAELCVEHGWSWFDLAGNYRLEIPELMQLQRTGQKPVLKQPTAKANLGTGEAGGVIRVLLALEHLKKRWTQREMQMHCHPKVSIGLVNKVVNYLRDEAFIEGPHEGGFRLRDPLKLLFAWRDAYRFERHERRSYFTLLQGKRQQEALAKLDSQSGGFAAYAAFSAADFQAPHVRQPKTWLFVNEREISKFEELVEAKQVESGENMIVLIPGDGRVFNLGDAGTTGQTRMACTNLVQTYVDLSHCGGRGEESAEALLEQRMKPEWKARRL